MQAQQQQDQIEEMISNCYEAPAQNLNICNIKYIFSMEALNVDTCSQITKLGSAY